MSVNRFRRRLLGGSGTLALMAAIPGSLPMSMAQALDSSTKIEKKSNNRLILLGTAGGPRMTKGGRSHPANALIVNGEPYLIDCGYGTVHQLELAGIDHRSIGKIFITHHHDDHNADLGTLMGLAWTNGRHAPTDAYGPPGTEAMVKAFIEYFKPNAEIRIADEHRTTRPESLFRGHDVTEAKVFYEDKNVKVTAAENTHYSNVETGLEGQRSWAYRFDTKDRSIVFSGDTAYSESVINLSKNADILVHEVLHKEKAKLTLNKALTLQGRSPEEISGVIEHVLGTHASPEDVGKVASRAKVKKVVLTHLYPADLPEDLFIGGVRNYFNGEIVVGKDLMEIFF